MTDFDDLRELIDQATPKPDATRRAQTLAQAQENFTRLQGSTDAPRPNSRTPFWTGAKTMLNTLTSRGGLTLTTAIVACGFLIWTPAGKNMLDLGRPATAPAPMPVTHEEAPAELIPTPLTEAERVTADVAASEVAPMAQTRAATPGTFASDSNGAIAADMAFDAEVLAPPPITEAFPIATPNPVQVTAQTPVSTFSIDVDTASYGVMRSSLMRGQLPPRDSVRIEELVNYFPYDYPAPDTNGAPFRPSVSVFETPWNPDTQLVHIGLQGALPAIETRPPLNLVFLIDTSGSMDSPDKLPLLRQSFRLMLDNLRPEDEVAIVTYAGTAGLALAPTPASDRQAILEALNGLSPSGGTNGQGGLEQAYAVAETMRQDGDVSRVLLATDGDFNIGLSSPLEMERYIATKRDSGTYLSVLGFGRGNLQDATMQALAQNGNGTAAYIDTLSEAQKVLVDQLTGALFPIANDVKIQVEFNPAQIAEYRLIGYETRLLERADFNNDRVDAGEIGAGHTVTAIYEVTPVGSPAILHDPLRYAATPPAPNSQELGFLRLRYKSPGQSDSQLIEQPITAVGAPNGEALFAAAISGFGQLLGDDRYLGEWGWSDAIALANENRGTDAFGYRQEAIRLMRLAESLSR